MVCCDWRRAPWLQVSFPACLWMKFRMCWLDFPINKTVKARKGRKMLKSLNWIPRNWLNECTLAHHFSFRWKPQACASLPNFLKEILIFFLYWLENINFPFLCLHCEKRKIIKNSFSGRPWLCGAFVTSIRLEQRRRKKRSNKFMCSSTDTRPLPLPHSHKSFPLSAVKRNGNILSLKVTVWNGFHLCFSGRLQGKLRWSAHRNK